MNQARKTDLLYKKAKGQPVNMSDEERRELRGYKVETDDGYFATRANISAYVKAVDQGYHLSFYDWCMSNKKADKRRKGSSAEELAADDRQGDLAAIAMGWLLWGLAIYWMFHGALSVGACAVAGIIVAVVLRRRARAWAGLTMFLLPIILAVVFYGRH